MASEPRSTTSGSFPATSADIGPLRVGIDTGGTFTDVVLEGAGEGPRVVKVRSTPDDPGRALLEGLDALGLTAGERGRVRVVHGTTVALNALLQRATPAVALVTNEGFRDLVEIDRQARPDLYALEPVRPAPLAPRELRFELGQRTVRIEAGDFVEERRPTDEEIARVADAVAASGARSAAVCLLHSYGDPGPERRVAEALRARGVAATASADLVAEYREAERFSTALCNAALVPVVQRYLDRLGEALGGTGLDVLASSGGSLSAASAAREPVRVLLSGPAGGVVGAARAAAAAGHAAIATLDMGGTSTDVAFHDPARGLGALGEEVRVAGHAIAVPTLDMHTIGCGGGSLARVDAAGSLRVGPESAGADPGPIAFGRGGTIPTVTDAYVVLGRIPHAPLERGFLGGALSLDVAAAERAFDALGERLGTDGVSAARAVVATANASMRRALGVMTMQRGRDPRETPLVAFGGGGGLAGADLAGALGMPCALLPLAAGVLSAAGMARADAAADRSRTVLRPAGELDQAAREAIVSALAAEASAELEGGPGSVDLESSFALRYRGQSYDLGVPGDAEDLEGAFHEAHEARFGWRLEDHPVEVVTARVRATRRMAGSTAPGAATPGADFSHEPLAHQRVHLDSGEVDVPVIAREDLAGAGAPLVGPAIVVEYAGTAWVPPGWTCTLRGGGALELAPSREDRT